MHSVVQNTLEQTIPGICFLRCGSVAVLMILRPREFVDEQCIVLTMYPCVPTGSLVFTGIPAGMLDGDTGNFVGKAAKEVYEETGFIIPPTELIDMTQMAPEGSKTPFQNPLEKATYLSPGRSDEYLRLLLWGESHQEGAWQTEWPADRTKGKRRVDNCGIVKTRIVLERRSKKRENTCCISIVKGVERVREI